MRAANPPAPLAAPAAPIATHLPDGGLSPEGTPPPDRSADRMPTDPPGRTALRLVGLIGLVYVVVQATEPGTRGRHLAALALTVSTGLTWTGWLLARVWRHRLATQISLAGLAASGGGLVVLSPAGVAVVGVAALSAASVLALPLAAGVAGLGVASAAVAIVTTHGSASVIGGAATGAVSGLAIGVTMRQQQERVAQAAQLALAEQRATLALERAEVLADRARIAREVHDVLAHTLSALSVQLTALGTLIDDAGADAAVHGAVDRARGLVVDGLRETRHAVRVLRDEPVALVDQLAALARDDGADFVVRGSVRSLPPAPGLALLRVAQESLTNARKHAPGAPVTVTVTFEDGLTRLAVENGMPRAASDLAATGGGYGVRGMRERVELLGGELRAGGDASGWRVEAAVPA